MSEEQLSKLIKQFNTMLEDKNQRPQVYHTKMVDDLITLATKVSKDDLHIETMKSFENAVQNNAELQMVLNSSILFYVVVLLQKTSSKQVQIQCMDLLAWLSQSEQCINALISTHNLHKVLIKLADSQLKQFKAPIQAEEVEFVVKLGALLVVQTTFSKKAQQLFQKLGFTQYFSETLKLSTVEISVQSDKLIQISLSVLEKMASETQQCEYLISQKVDSILLQLLQNYIQETDESRITQESCMLSCNLLATMCVVVPSSAQHFLELQALRLLLEVLQITTHTVETSRFALSAFVELIYANKGSKYQNVTTMLRSVGDPCLDDTMRRLLVLYDILNMDSESIAVWGTLFRMIGTVPRKEDYVREIILQNGFISKSIELIVDQNLSLQAKGAILDALGQFLTVQNLPKNVLMNDIPKLITVLLRTKREFSSPRNKTKVDKVVFAEAAEKCRAVLEKLGHSEGKDNKKLSAYAMVVVGVGILIGTGINYLRGPK
ncbi:Conserved_hypothetical protein [Hexamita inflata]|uniref:Uncharacterized protein n=1 Tax=Hexamita inflata TaxID=28002 RepID=A0AA86NTD2_9EUKA|nr:Conserved hypothetical protein [Hexamita inflata]